MGLPSLPDCYNNFPVYDGCIYRKAGTISLPLATFFAGLLLAFKPCSYIFDTDIFLEEFIPYYCK